MDAISIQQLSLHYGPRRGIEDVDLSVNAGEIFGFLGPNGAGKSTTIRILMGLLRANSGAAKIQGLDCWSQSAEIKRRVGYLPGDVRLYPWLTANNALQIVSEIRNSAGVKIAGNQLLERFQLETDVPVRKMSRGMRQKLGIVLALAHQPSVLILDEPTSGLDPLMCEELYRCLKEAAATGATVFFSSHTLAEVELLCERVAIVRAGKIIADEKLEVLRGHSRRAVTLRFARGFEACNLEVPPFLELTEQSNSVWRGELVGTTPQLVKWAAALELQDLEVGPPSLESLFRRYYSPQETV
jgi:ABC-2 type transport system ATP-binding protein